MIFSKINDKDIQEVLQEYRKIGTVEEFKKLKEKEEELNKSTKMFYLIGLGIRNRTINEFVEVMQKEIEDYSFANTKARLSENDILRLAEQLKSKKGEQK